MSNRKKYYSAICSECDEEYFYTYTEILSSSNLKCPECGKSLHININEIVTTYKK